MKEFIRVMKALSDPNRVVIMKLLEAREFCVCEITGVLGLAQSTVSKHLKILEDADLIESWKSGAWVNYKLAQNPENQYAEALQKKMKEWLADSPQIKEFLSRAEKVDRLTLCQTNEIKRMVNG